MENKGGAGATLRKHLFASGIKEWGDFCRSALYEFRDEVVGSVAPSTAKTIMAIAKAFIKRYQDEVDIPNDWEKILSAKGDSSRSTYLTPEELRAFEAVKTNSPAEHIVQVESLIEAYTGARLSDVMSLTEANFAGGYLTYTSQKTHITATIPVSKKTRGWIVYAQNHREDEPCLVARNRIIRRLAQRAGINEIVKTRHAGVERTTPKWQVLSSHDFRKSCATNLVLAGASLTEAKLVLGHTSEAMTSRYVVASCPNLSPEALKYFET